MAIITAIFNETVVEEPKVSDISFYDFVEKIQKEFDEQLAEIVVPEPSEQPSDSKQPCEKVIETRERN